MQSSFQADPTTFPIGSLAQQTETALMNIIRRHTHGLNDDRALSIHDTAATLVRNAAKAWRQIIKSMLPASNYLTGQEVRSLADAARSLATAADARFAQEIAACLATPFEAAVLAGVRMTFAEEVIMAASKTYLVLSNSVDDQLRAAVAGVRLGGTDLAPAPVPTQVGNGSQAPSIAVGPAPSGAIGNRGAGLGIQHNSVHWGEDEDNFALGLLIVYRGQTSWSELAHAINEEFGNSRTKDAVKQREKFRYLNQQLATLDAQCDPANPMVAIDWKTYGDNYHSDHDPAEDLDEMLRRHEAGELEDSDEGGEVREVIALD
ncbi:hypothetical protein LTR10_012273 [Elasticomyces elasticus]|nr:hypothetical protein LTR10_012273 [Elasticomyces elasticus]KAK4965750.1 hypothetical protein LTR42_011763 [Elasticomyces elasticus]